MLGTHDHLAVRALDLSRTVTRVIRLKWSSPRTRDIDTYCRTFDRGAVITCFNVLSLWRLGFEHPTFRLQGERSNPLRYRLGSETCNCKIEY